MNYAFVNAIVERRLVAIVDADPSTLKSNRRLLNKSEFSTETTTR